MGISGLLRFVKDATEEIHIKKYAGQTVAIDTYCWIHRGSFACAEKLAKNEHTDQYVKYCMKFIDMLESFRVKPILVFDGCRLPSKELVEQERHKRRKENLEKGKRLLREGKLSAARDCFTKCVSVTPAMALRVIEAARARGVDCVVAPYEADAQLAFLSKENLAQAIVTEDSDLLCFGCKNVVFKMDLTGRAQEVSSENLGRVKNLIGFTPDLFRHMCILSGCDYLPSVRGVGLVKACKALKMSKSKDSYHVAAKLHQYVKGLSPVDVKYGKEFVRADKTFLYQLVFDPKKRKIQPLNQYPSDVEAKDLEFAGPLISNEKAFQIALGNIDINTQLVISYFDVDAWIISRKPADKLPSVWGDRPIGVPTVQIAPKPKLELLEKPNRGDAVESISSADVLDAISNDKEVLLEKELKKPSLPKNAGKLKTIHAGDMRELLKTYQMDKSIKNQSPAKVVKSRFFVPKLSLDQTKDKSFFEQESTHHSSSLFSDQNDSKSNEDALLNDILDEINDKVEVGVKRGLSSSNSALKRKKELNSSSEALEKFAYRRKRKRLTLPSTTMPSTSSSKATEVELLSENENVPVAKSKSEVIENDESIPFLDKECVSQSLFGTPLYKSAEESVFSDQELSDVVNISDAVDENDSDENVPVSDNDFHNDTNERPLKSPRKPLSSISNENCSIVRKSLKTYVISSDEETVEDNKCMSPQSRSRRLGLPSRGRFKSPVKLNVSKYFKGSKASGLRKSRKSLPNQPSIKSFFASKT